jgi:hypothetical protein
LRKYRWQSLGKHGFACTRRADHQKVVSSSRRNFESLNKFWLPKHFTHARLGLIWLRFNPQWLVHALVNRDVGPV